MDNATLVWINTILLAMLGFCIVAVARWFFSKFNTMMKDMATKQDLLRFEIELGKKIDEKDCFRSHTDIKPYLHTHSSLGQAGEAVYRP